MACHLLGCRHEPNLLSETYPSPAAQSAFPALFLFCQTAIKSCFSNSHRNVENKEKRLSKTAKQVKLDPSHPTTPD